MDYIIGRLRYPELTDKASRNLLEKIHGINAD